MDRQRIKNTPAIRKKTGATLSAWKAQSSLLRKTLLTLKGTLAKAEKAKPYNPGDVATTRLAIKEVKLLITRGQSLISTAKSSAYVPVVTATATRNRGSLYTI